LAAIFICTKATTLASSPNATDFFNNLLDLLGAEIDHVESRSGGGPSDLRNFVTACHKCNLRKGSKTPTKWNERSKEKPIKSKYGEPQHWDGLSAVFVMLANRYQAELTADEREWIKEFA
jgi:hypothetical protein